MSELSRQEYEIFLKGAEKGLELLRNNPEKAINNFKNNINTLKNNKFVEAKERINKNEREPTMTDGLPDSLLENEAELAEQVAGKLISTYKDYVVEIQGIEELLKKDNIDSLRTGGFTGIANSLKLKP